jgi:hypothetical protein
MPYQFSPQGLAVQESVKRFMDDFIYPNEERYYSEASTVRPRTPATWRSCTATPPPR